MAMTEEVEQLLKNLKLRRMLSVYDEQLRAAEKGDVSYSEFVAGLLRAQWHDRQDSALEWRIRRAKMPERWSLETFPWPHQPGVNRKQMHAFAELDFVAKHENLVFVGPTGRGKTGLACGLLLKALQNRTGMRAPVEGFAKRLSLSVHPRARSVRRNVRLAGRSLDAPVTESTDSFGCIVDRRVWLLESQTGTVEHLLQADGGTIHSSLDDHHHELGV